MASTVVGIGGLVFQAIIIPLSFSSITKVDRMLQATLLESIRKRFEPLAWLSLFVLIGTGLVQMSANPSYEGVFSISNRWAASLLAKHLTIGLMVIIAGVQTWVIQPRINRIMLQIAQAKAEADEITPMLRRHRTLHQINFILAILVLGFTAIARSS